MLATLVIGLREGLEAALIVGIIAAFLRRTGASLRPMWLGVAAAIALSLGVGVTLEIISAELPQAQQEALETIIGVIAVVFVTSMIAWMNRHAKGLKRDLERSAATAVRGGTTWALVAMAFLAVLKEGFETSVFLLAAFQSSTSSLVAGAGALLGIGISVGIGIGIYRGGIRLNLSKFFRITGVFLVFVAAGLVLSAVRTAHEAGWIQIGQQATIDLGWLAPTGSIQAALLTGILGIPADPRLIEVLAWALYLVPVLAYLLWPVALRPAPERLPRLWVTLAAGLAAVGIVLAIAVPLPARRRRGRRRSSPAPAPASDRRRCSRPRAPSSSPVASAARPWSGDTPPPRCAPPTTRGWPPECGTPRVRPCPRGVPPRSPSMSWSHSRAAACPSVSTRPRIRGRSTPPGRPAPSRRCG